MCPQPHQGLLTWVIYFQGSSGAGKGVQWSEAPPNSLDFHCNLCRYFIPFTLGVMRRLVRDRVDLGSAYSPSIDQIMASLKKTKFVHWLWSLFAGPTYPHQLTLPHPHEGEVIFINSSFYFQCFFLSQGLCTCFFYEKDSSILFLIHLPPSHSSEFGSKAPVS